MHLIETLSNWSVNFDSPRYLVLLAILPAFWFVGRRSLAALGNRRRHFALTLRLAIATFFIIALAEPNWQSLLHRLSVMFVVDASSSVQRQ